MAKVHYQTHKVDVVRDIVGDNENENTNEVKRRKPLDDEQLKEFEDFENFEAESRRVFDPMERTFDHGAKRVTAFMSSFEKS